MLQACLNGSRTAEEHPALPLSAERLAEDAADVAALGVTSVHIHPRDVIGALTLVGPEVATTIATVRAAVPGIEISVSTDVPGHRGALIGSWAPLAAGRPDIASVHVGRPGWRDLAEALHRVNVEVELVVASPGLLTDLPDGVSRITVTATRETAESLLGEVEPLGLPVLLHGRDADAWSVLDYAALLEHHVRMGLEDTLHLPDGRPAKNNAELVALARRRQRSRAPS
ncbi:3-keto-5-aminohexanoate cleavage protein [Lentzea sp. BCCO 10_0798]|uniref:3-keto-5-aminohexanoate cleavage protein n=1 Tax=Lentzea kristufekii TaxID=3095430 RepID=A0ABU4U6W1_9PSEU|nr:3-keto-5-aminohexanoate cleavage protein [Lentzea sp. BCCO 10_0798]MDX8055979.1 3-keto-5-aminohexanoate cleavage protein [Lentzea sp. BCCO 10_0798]